MSDFKSNLHLFKQKFDYFLEIELKNIQNQIPNFGQLTQAGYQKITDLTLGGGKRIRPFLAESGFKLINPNLNNSKIKTSLTKLQLCLELFQTFCLIHDDIIDQSSIRRGQSSVHEFFKAKWLNNPKQAEYLAILIGDMANFLADNFFNQIKSLHFEKLAQVFNLMKLELVTGQIEDSFGVGLAEIKLLTSKSVLTMLDLKSGRYSIQKPMILGAILAGANDVDLKILGSFGQKLGLIFQLTDDYLGVFGNTKITGKSNSSDILEGKKTFLLMQTYQNSNASEQKFLKEYLNKIKQNQTINSKIVNQVITLMQKNGKNKVEELIKDLSQKIKTDLAKLQNFAGFEDSNLNGLTNFLIDRKD